MKASPSLKLLFYMLSLPLLILLVTGCSTVKAPHALNEAILEVDAPSQEYVLEHGYPANDAGLTYGPLMPFDFYGTDAEYNPDVMPDLLLVTSDEGYIGYVNWDEMLGEEPGSIDEAMENSSIGPRELPVYTEDGTTVIGTFTIG